MKQPIRIADSKRGPAIIDIEGTIGVPEQWQFENPDERVATYEKFSRTLEAVSRLRGGEIVVNISSTGGDVGDALLIHDALLGTGATVTTRCRGYVASAATIIAQAASEGRREISSSSLYLVHNSVASCEGNATDLSRGIELLAKTDERIASIYARRSGRPEADFTALMAENNGGGRWLSPAEAIEAGLADRIVESDGARDKAPKKRRPSPPAAAVRPEANLSIADERTRRAIADGMRAQMETTPTKLQTMEDPAPAEGRRSANEIAYRLDAENFLS